MSRYTELYKDYVERGGAIPASFGMVEGFEDIFYANYCDCEIGFETESIFAVKLEAKANIIMPLVKNKIDLINAQYPLLIESPARVRIDTRVYGEAVSSTTADGSETELPLGGVDNPTPSSTTSTNGSTTLDEHTDVFTKDEGLSANERIKIIEHANEQIASVVDKALKAFKSLFMGVYL